jgi:hypothetical protein
MRTPQSDEHAQRGVVMVMTAILLVVMVGMAGFAVDLGWWYTRTGQLQRAADAAALAGVVYMPTEFAQARAAAEQTLLRNHGMDDTTHSIEPVPGNPRRLQVCVSDDDVGVFFVAVFNVRPAAMRCATAEYVRPVALGSPENSFGVQDYRGIWGAVNGYCTAQEDGDLRLSRYQGTRPSSGGGNPTQCPPQGATGGPSPDYDRNGYTYMVELGPSPTNPLRIEAYDASYNEANPSNADLELPTTASGNTQVNTMFTLYDATDTPLDATDDPQLGAPRVINSDDTSWRNQWRNLFTLNNPQAFGRYRIRVQTLANQANSVGVNGWGLRARLGGSFTPPSTSSFARCTADQTESGGGVTFSTNCPRVHGEHAISVYANDEDSTAEFYLAKVDAVHAGKQMIINLFDPGEGGNTIRVIDPNGNPVSFTWRTVDEFAGTSGSGSSLDVSGTVSPQPGRSSRSRFNERKVELTINLAGDYAARYGTRTWWKLRYSFPDEVTDRTTWSVDIRGDPVRLVPNP